MATSQLVIAVLGLAVLACADSQHFPLCMSMIRDLTMKNIDLLVDVGGSMDPNLQEHRCTTATGRLQVFYSCREGYEPTLTRADDVENIDLMINLSEFPEDEKRETIVTCKRSEGSGEAAAAALTTAKAAVSTTPPPTPLCSELMGTTNINAYEAESQPRVMAVQCKFVRPSFGSGEITELRILYVCSEGEAMVNGPLYRRTYTCPPTSTAGPATTTTMPPPTSHTPETTPPPMTTPTEATTTQPATTTEEEEPLCSTIDGYNIYSYTITSRSRLCRVRCRLSGGNTKSVYVCCHGTPEKMPGRRQFSCPEQ